MIRVGDRVRHRFWGVLGTVVNLLHYSEFGALAVVNWDDKTDAPEVVYLESLIDMEVL